MKVLYLRNSSDTADQLQRQLQELQYEVVLSGSVKTATWELENNLDIDIVIASYRLDSGTSVYLLKEVRSDLSMRLLPMLMACDNWTEAGVAECMELRANAIIALPVTSSTLLSKVRLADQLGRPRVLIVDDEPLILDLLKEHLELNRMRVATASSAEEAMDILAGQKFDVIVSDILLPGKTGVHLLEEVKMNPQFGETPVILITGHSGKYSPDFALSHGADGYLTKPFHNMDLIYTVQSAVDRKRHNHQRRPAPVVQ